MEYHYVLVDILNFQYYYKNMERKSLSDKEIAKIKEMRVQGYSILEISNNLNIAKSTVFRHMQGVLILPEFLSLWLAKREGSKKRKLANKY